MDLLDIDVVGRGGDTKLIYEVKIDHQHVHARVLEFDWLILIGL